MAEHSGKDILSSDVEIEGSIKFQKELLIDGKVKGEIISDGILTIVLAFLGFGGTMYSLIRTLNRKDRGDG